MDLHGRISRDRGKIRWAAHDQNCADTIVKEIYSIKKIFKIDGGWANTKFKIFKQIWGTGDQFGCWASWWLQLKSQRGWWVLAGEGADGFILMVVLPLMLLYWY